MRIVLAHSFYRHRAGEDTAYLADVELLRTHGHDVECFTIDNDETAHLSPVTLGVRAIWSRPASAAMRRTVRAFKPDLVHVHNWFPLMSPAIFRAVRSEGVPVVATVHNYRLHCIQGMHRRDGRICEDCVGRSPLPGVVHRCYRDSLLASGTLAATLTVHRAAGTFKREVDRWIALSPFSRAKLVEGGLPAARIVVRPNFCPDPGPGAPVRTGSLFVGRLSPDKGVDVLVDALGRVREPTMLSVLGQGPLQGSLQGVRGVTMLGLVPRAEVDVHLKRAAWLVLPSNAYESCSMAVIEAFAAGTPVIASRLGPLAEMVEDDVTGLLFEPGDAAALAGKLDWAATHPEQMAEMGRRARARFEASYSEAAAYRAIMHIYDDVLRGHDGHPRGEHDMRVPRDGYTEGTTV
jgi:glycosyltransferase involved in cell wall biosynthesis